LTAANAVDDYINGKFLIIGGKVRAYQHEAERIIKLTQPNLQNVKFCSISEAALAKYAINSFLATKVVFMNELWSVAVASGLDFDTIASMIKLDERIGNSHTKVPGPDGSFGFGGYCFPKDTAALLKYAESVNKPLNVLDAAVKKNTLLRLHG
jgi:UDPglucose 6-dehydrogenase